MEVSAQTFVQQHKIVHPVLTSKTHDMKSTNEAMHVAIRYRGFSYYRASLGRGISDLNGTFSSSRGT